MKKLLIIILGCTVVTGAFAEFSFSFSTGFNAYMFSTLIPTGMASDKTMINDDGNVVTNTGTTRLDPMWLIRPDSMGRQGFYVPSGSFGFFAPRISSQNTNNFEEYINYLNDMQLGVNFNRGIMFLHLTFHLRDILFATLNGQTLSLNGMLNTVLLPDFIFGFDHAMFGFIAGSNEEKRMVNQYRDFTDWSMKTTICTIDGMVNNFGVLVPISYPDPLPPDHRRKHLIFRPVLTPFSFTINPLNPTEVNDHFTAVGTIKLLDYRLNIPITFDLGWIFDHQPINAGSAAVAQTRINFGTAVRGRGIAGLFNFDLVYKLRGGDGNIDDSWDAILNPGGGFQPDGTGAYSHFLSLAFGFPDLVPNFGFSLGYTALFSVYEDWAPRPNDTINPHRTRTGPLYSGIDLHMRYTGIDRLTLSLNNNVSFARASEPTYNENNLPTNHSVDIFGTGNLARHHSQTWFALHNVLTGRYAINNRFSANVEFMHRLAIINHYNNDDNRGSTLADWGRQERRNRLIKTSFYTRNNLTSYIALEAGFAMWAETRTTTFSDYINPGFSGPTSWESGAIAIGMPLRVVVSF